ncbi:Eukaryotic translation initiation factor 3 subunit K [Vanrija pseudolonga]|uniref:Eukaryotic translation initiation factor 3 subunit K n=1 Tax=Vanrija pseudolonga TaxID=143232 RepID=A0AAF0Y459_9TREE|nr:Eukaryotic translation initiation factor 3 subunit K [Vanrija pseudolonga]
MAATHAPVPPKTLKEWHTPSTRTEVIHELIHGVDRYNPSNLPFMEEYLTQQVQTGTYDLLANLAILKLYQFNPQLSNPDIIINILIKALSATVHGPDFGVCLALLREPAAILHDIDSEDESFIATVPFLQSLHELIRTCQFTKFWSEFNGSSDAAKLLRTNPNYFPQHGDIVDTFRTLFATSIAASFRRVRLSQLARWLSLKDAEVAAWAKTAGWEIDGDVAVVPKNGDNDVKAGVVKENVELKQLTKLVASAAV